MGNLLQGLHGMTPNDVQRDVHCSCQRSMCEASRCICKISDISCTELCSCIDCLNHMTTAYVRSAIADEEDDKDGDFFIRVRHCRTVSGSSFCVFYV